MVAGAVPISDGKSANLKLSEKRGRRARMIVAAAKQFTGGSPLTSSLDSDSRCGEEYGDLGAQRYANDRHGIRAKERLRQKSPAVHGSSPARRRGALTGHLTRFPI